MLPLVAQRMTATTSRAPLLIPKTLVARLLRLYDVPHPAAPDRLIRGYDRPHAVRTARMCAAGSGCLAAANAVLVAADRR